MKSPVLASALATAVSLGGGMAVGAVVAGLLTRLPFAFAQGMAGVVGLMGIVGGGAFWGAALARIHNFPDRSATSGVGALAFPFAMSVAMAILAGQERKLIQEAYPGLPIHNVYTLVFVPAAFLVASVGGGAILLIGGHRTHWLGSALATGAAAAAAFLVVNVFMDTLGWRVGGPGAAERATMLTVTFVGALGAALAGGAMLGWRLAKGAGATSPS